MDYSVLTRAPLFTGISANEIEVILSQTPHRFRKFEAGAMVTQAGEPVNSLMIVISGSVKGEMVDFAGRVIKIEDIPAPGALAPAFMFGSKNRFPVNVLAITATELLVIERPYFLKMMMANDKILINFLNMISNRSQFLSEKIKFLNFKTIKGKLAQYFLEMAGETKTEIKLTGTQNDLADFFGVARPSIARAIGEMEEEGMIRAAGKVITITDRAKLSELTRE
jgi:CRP/FNR family transcriptional regulator, dissimilatory nitrate respiration regulator